MRAVADQQLAWRHEHEPQIGQADFPWDDAHAHARKLVEAMEYESARLASVEVPEEARELRRYTLAFYENSTEIFRRQSEVFELLERMSAMQFEPNPDQALAQALVARYEAVQQGLEVLAEQVRANERSSRAERERLLAML